MAMGERFGSIFEGGSALGLGPAELLGRFAASRDESALSVLVDRHGPMVLATCRRILPDHADADDAFQATFLVLARKAASLDDPDRLAPWLHGVARRVAIRARAQSARRRAVEEAGQGEAAIAPAPGDGPELRAILDEELAQLPAKYRDPLVLCYLEGLTHDEAASQLAWPVGTVRSRLAGGRDRLRSRLTRRGFAPGALAVLVAPATLPAVVVSQSLMVATVRLACTGGANKMATAAVVLAQGVLTTMFLTKIQTATIATLAVAATMTAGTVAVVAQQQPTSATIAAPASQPAEGSVAKWYRAYQNLAKIRSNQWSETLQRESQAVTDLESTEIGRRFQQRLQTGSPAVIFSPEENNELKRLDPQLAADFETLEKRATYAKRPATLPGPPMRLATIDLANELGTARERIKVLETELASLKQQGTPETPAQRAKDLALSGPITPPVPPLISPMLMTDAQRAADSRPWTIPLPVGSVLYSPAERDRVTVLNLRSDRSLSYKNPGNVKKIVPIYNENMVGLSLEGPNVTEVAAFSLSSNQWIRQPLRQPVKDGKITPVVGNNMVYYAVGKSIYILADGAPEWSVLDLKEPVTVESLQSRIISSAEGMIVTEGDTLHADGFGLGRAGWTKATIRDDQEEANPRDNPATPPQTSVKPADPTARPLVMPLDGGARNLIIPVEQDRIIVGDKVCRLAGQLSRIIPIASGGVVGLKLKGPRVTQVGAYDIRTDAWITTNLREPIIDGEIEPVVSATSAEYRIGRLIYHLDTPSKTWIITDLDNLPR